MEEDEAATRRGGASVSRGISSTDTRKSDFATESAPHRLRYGVFVCTGAQLQQRAHRGRDLCQAASGAAKPVVIPFAGVVPVCMLVMFLTRTLCNTSLLARQQIRLVKPRS